jgi:hypothetical protein
MRLKEFEGLGRSIARELPEFAVKGNLVFIRPITHTLRAILFEGSRFYKTEFYAHVFIQPLFCPAPVIALNLGWRIRNGHSWDKQEEEVGARILATLREEAATSFLRQVRTPHDVVTAVSSLGMDGNFFAQRATAYALARSGESTTARGELMKLIGVCNSTQLANEAVLLLSELETSETRAQRLLEVWEAETAEKLKLSEFRSS